MFYWYIYSYLQIDATAVQTMNDKDLSAYIPAFGDRVNLKSLCKPNNEKKAALFDKLRKKMKLYPNDSDSNKRPNRSMTVPRK